MKIAVIRINITVGGLSMLLSGVVYGQESGRMNVLFIVADDMRPELGCYGVEDVITPYIDSLAGRSTVFMNAYCNIPVSGASRASLFTGMYPRYPHRFTAFDAWAERDCPQAMSLPECFRNGGYYVVSNGKVFHNIEDHADSWSETPWRVHPDGYGKDWAEYNKWELWKDDASSNFVNPKTLRGPYCEAANVSDTAYIDGRVAQKTIADLRRLKSMGKPFFLACGFWKPHLPFNAPKKYWDLYRRENITPADNPYRPEELPRQVTSSGEIRGYGKFSNMRDKNFQLEAKHGYYACVSYIDRQIGLVLDELKRLGLDKNTIIVILGDHGWHLGEHGFWGKHNLMEHSTHAPLIVHVPGMKGGKSNGIVEFVDIYPTLCDLCGVKPPMNQLHGISLVPMLKDCTRRVKNYAFIQWQKGYDIVTERYNAAIWLKNDSVVARMLFDHCEDAGENRNVATDPCMVEDMLWIEKEIKNRIRELNN